MNNNYYTSLVDAQDLLDFLLELQSDGFILEDLDLNMEYVVKDSEEGYSYTQKVIAPSFQIKKEKGKTKLIISP